ncbi:MAG: thiamine pyrophosphate-binding protein [Chromatiaceae bacterium]|nr:thiamine pyrophosphate-binding protein [Chromatiaceae bacterium]
MQRLADTGLRHVFLLPGGGAMYLNDALACEKRLIPVPCHHEQACGIAAEAYGRTGHPDNPGFGVALVTTGPGATNIITPVAGAWIDSIPLLVISGGVKRADRLAGRPLRQSGVQEVDIIPMVRGITNYAVTLDDPNQVRAVLETALHRMRAGRPGPVWIEIPLDVQAAPIDPTALPGPPDELIDTPNPDPDQLARILDLLAQAERPLILAGHGVRLSGAAEAFRILYERWQVPVVTTWNALDLIPFAHPLCVGRPGVVALRAPNFAVQNCDLLIAIGCRLDNIITAYNPGNFARAARKVVVDVDAAELDKPGMVMDEAIQGDAAVVIAAWLAAESPPAPDRSSWLLRCQQWKARWPVNDGQPFAPSDTISHYHFVAALSDAIPPKTLIVTGSSGLGVEAFYSTFRNSPGQRLFLTSGLGAMGYGLAAAIGACLGNGGQPTVAIESDGSLMLNLQELATLKGLNLPLRLVIMDNHGYASIRNTQRNYFDGRYIATGPEGGLHLPNLAAVAEAMGLPCVRIDTPEALAPGLRKVMETYEPIVCIVRLVSNESLWPKAAALPQPDGSILSMPLEDMTPLLDIDTLQREMIIALASESHSAYRP